MEELEEKIYNGEKLTQQELEDAIWGCDKIDEINGSNRRWTQPVTTVIQVKDKLFAINWERGLTESQEHEFNSQPYEVVKKTRMVEETYYEAK